MHAVCTKAHLAYTVCTWRAWGMVHIKDISSDHHEKTECVYDVLLLSYGPCMLCIEAHLVCTVCTLHACGIHVHLENISSDLQDQTDQNRRSGYGSNVHANCDEKQITQPSTFEKYNVHEKNSCVHSIHPTCKIQVCAWRSYTHGPRKKNGMHFGYRGAEK